MCLIIQRPANTALDYDKFETAVMNNGDGWGFSAATGEGELYTFRDHNKWDAKDIYKVIQEDFKDVPVLVHLRFTTAGKTILRNAHPFPILEKRTHGIDIRMAHNGTLHKYKGNTVESDTRRFVKGYVRPLFERLIQYYGDEPQDILCDPFVEKFLDAELTGGSVLSFIDGYGNTLNVNEAGNGGFHENNVYYSNKYSFNDTHRVPSKVVYDYTSYYKSTDNPTSSTYKATDTKVAPHAKDTEVVKFTDKYNITKLEDLFNLSDEFISEMVEKFPADTELLIKELLYRLYMHEQNISEDV